MKQQPLEIRKHWSNAKITSNMHVTNIFLFSILNTEKAAGQHEQPFEAGHEVR